MFIPTEKSPHKSSSNLLRLYVYCAGHIIPKNQQINSLDPCIITVKKEKKKNSKPKKKGLTSLVKIDCQL